MHLRFWIKNIVSAICPNTYIRNLRQYRIANYDFECNKYPVQDRYHGKGGRREDRHNGLRYRDYESYAAYIAHQQQKLDEMIKVKGGFRTKDLLAYRLTFYQRFRILPNYLSTSAQILCAGARQGTEVEVLHDLGFRNAYGIDLNPGPENKLVRSGDFMHLENADSSLDMIYSNCVDHAFDLDEFFKEHARVIKPDGYALYDISLEDGGAFEAVEWESGEIVLLIMLRYFKSVIKIDTEKRWRWILLHGTKGT